MKLFAALCIALGAVTSNDMTVLVEVSEPQGIDLSVEYFATGSEDSYTPKLMVGVPMYINFRGQYHGTAPWSVDVVDANFSTPDFVKVERDGKWSNEEGLFSFYRHGFFTSPGEKLIRIVLDPDNLITEKDESNNVLTERIVVEPRCDETNDFSFQNVSTHPVTPAVEEETSLTVKFNNTFAEDDNQPEPEIKVEGTGNFLFSWATSGLFCKDSSFWDGSFLSEGPQSITVTLDPDNLVAESDETNNTMTITVNVSPRVRDFEILNIIGSDEPWYENRMGGLGVEFRDTISPSGSWMAPYSVTAPGFDMYLPTHYPPLRNPDDRNVYATTNGGSYHTPGTYEVMITLDPENLTVEDDEANNTMTRTITVLSEEDYQEHISDLPQIVRNGPREVRVQCGEEYVELGATATDRTDGDISSQVVVMYYRGQYGSTQVEEIDTSTRGEYNVNYSITDSDGNTRFSETRYVFVRGECP